MSRPFSLRLGVREYSITPEEYLDPGLLTTRVADDKICGTGGFIGRLETWTPEDGMRNVQDVKAFIKHPSTADRFHPEWLQRKSLSHRVLFRILSIHDQSVEGTSEEELARAKGALHRLQSKMKRAVKSCDFAPDSDTGELWKLLDSESGFEVADLVLDNLENLNNHVAYLQNMTMTPPLATCAGVSMCDMNTGLQKLSNKPLPGITQPTVYIGTEFSTFACHREDMSFLAMNRHIAGAPKIWFIVPPAYYEAFIWLLRNLPIPDDQKVLACHLSHKDIWICPRTVVAWGIPIFTIVQRPGDIVYLLYTIRWGFNVNFNLNEAINYVSPMWVLPGMLSHQRCQCHAKWASRFEIRDVLAAHGASATHLKMWSSGVTMAILQELKSSHPLLYTRLHDVYDQCLDEEAMASGVVKVVTPTANPANDDDAPMYPSCTLCSYCPARCRSDAYDRIRQHVLRCHGPEHCDDVISLARERYENLKRQQTEKKIFKCPAIVCPRCKKTVHGNASRLAEHQASRRCLPKGDAAEEDGDDPDPAAAGPSSREATKRRRTSSRNQ